MPEVKYAPCHTDKQAEYGMHFKTLQHGCSREEGPAVVCVSCLNCPASLGLIPACYVVGLVVISGIGSMIWVQSCADSIQWQKSQKAECSLPCVCHCHACFLNHFFHSHRDLICNVVCCLMMTTVCAKSVLHV